VYCTEEGGVCVVVARFGRPGGKEATARGVLRRLGEVEEGMVWMIFFSSMLEEEEEKRRVRVETDSREAFDLSFRFDRYFFCFGWFLMLATVVASCWCCAFR